MIFDECFIKWKMINTKNSAYVNCLKNSPPNTWKNLVCPACLNTEETTSAGKLKLILSEGVTNAEEEIYTAFREVRLDGKDLQITLLQTSSEKQIY